MHVGVLPTIDIEGTPIPRELFGDRTESLFPKAFTDHRRNVGEQSVCVGMARDLGAGSGQEHKGMAVGLLGAIRRPAVTDAPIVTTELRVAMAFPQKIHSVIDDDVGAGPAHQMRDRECVDNPRRGVKVTSRGSSCAVARSHWSALIIEIVKSAERINNSSLKKGEQIVRLLKEPCPMAGQLGPFAV